MIENYLRLGREKCKEILDKIVILRMNNHEFYHKSHEIETEFLIK